MTPTPVPTPSMVVQTVIEQGLVSNYLLVFGSVYAVCFLFIFVSMVEDRQRSQFSFFIILLVCLPLLILNAGWWALSVYFFFLLYRIVVSLRELVH